jgi:geranylgeranyl diphosphate synthase type I
MQPTPTFHELNFFHLKRNPNCIKRILNILLNFIDFVSTISLSGYLYAVNLSPNLDLPSIRTAVNQALADFIKEGKQYLSEIGPELDPVAREIEKFLLSNGKRLRPIFAITGFLAAGGSLNRILINACSSLELIHVCALIHDDVMDHSDTRRGAPSIHKIFESIHVQQKLSGSATQFGNAAAILMGDLALVWSAQMLHKSGVHIEQLSKALPFYDEMRVELMAGQYLDIFEQSLASQSIERSLKVARFKSGKYTIERPLHFGSSLVNNSEKLLSAFSAYGIPLGEAFQLRDDLLGVFGDPAKTGKPSGDDLKEGKRTALIAAVMERANPSESKLLDSVIGDPNLSEDDISKIQEIIRSTGALSHIESLISKLAERALNALAFEGFTKIGKDLMTELVQISTNRNI